MLNIKETLQLLEAGYTREEILQMKSMPEEKPAEEPEVKPAETAKEPEIPAWATQMSADLAELKKAIYAVNVMTSEQPAKESVDDVLMRAMKGGK